MKLEINKIISHIGALFMDKFNKKKLVHDRDFLKKTISHPYITPQELHDKNAEGKKTNRDEFRNPCGSGK